MSKPRERAVKEIKPDGKVVLMSKKDEQKWRKTVKSNIDGQLLTRRKHAD